MAWWKITLIALAVVVGGIGLSYAFGWIGVHQTGTIGKAKKDVERQVFEQSQSYVEGKRQEAIKYRLEYMRADSIGKAAIKMTIVQSFANFDETKLSYELQEFISKMKQ